jgi:VIT1/CCC1 family predicted Fe2+/Mn2+ transporter
LAQEQDAAAVYRTLARRRHGEEREILLALARAEERHAAHWAAQLHPAEPAPRRLGLRARLLSWLARRLGSLLVLALVQRAEAADDYDSEPDATPAMAADERVHALVVAGLAQRHRARASGWFRAAVFGANDGLVSNFSLVLGMAGAGSSSQVVLLAGLAGRRAVDGRRRVHLGTLAAGAVGHRRPRARRSNATTAARARCRRAGAGLPRQGLPTEQAEQRAAALLGGDNAETAGGDDDAGQEVVGSAAGAAGSSFVAFAGGAAIPVLPFVVASGTAAIVIASVLVGVALFATGAAAGVLTGGPLLRRGLRQLAIGAAAAAVTYGLGRLFGATVG